MSSVLYLRELVQLIQMRMGRYCFAVTGVSVVVKLCLLLLMCVSATTCSTAQSVPHAPETTCHQLNQFYGCDNHSSIMPTWCSEGNPFIVAQPPTSLSPGNTDSTDYRQAYSCDGEGPFADCRLIEVFEPAEINLTPSSVSRGRIPNIDRCSL